MKWKLVRFISSMTWAEMWGLVTGPSTGQKIHTFAPQNGENFPIICPESSVCVCVCLPGEHYYYSLYLRSEYHHLIKEWSILPYPCDPAALRTSLHSRGKLWACSPAPSASGHCVQTTLSHAAYEYWQMRELYT